MFSSEKYIGVIYTLITKLVSIEVWVAVAAVFVSLVWLRLLPVALGVMVLYWPLRWLVNGYPSLRTPADVVIVFLLLMMPITLWATALPEITRPQVYRLLTGIGLFYALINWITTKVHLRLIILGLSLSGIGLAIIGLVTVQWDPYRFAFIPSEIYNYLPKLGSEIIHRNVMAGSLVILLPIIVGFLLFDWAHIMSYERILYLGSAIVVLFVLILTKSRGGLIAFSVTILLLTILRWRLGWILLVAVPFLVGIFTYSYGLTSSLEAITYNETLPGIDVRLDIWSRAIYMIQDFSITGIGMGSFGDLADMLYPFFLSEPGSVPHAHNLYLQIAVDLGIPGLVCWLAILFVVIFTSWKLSRQGKELGDAWMAGLGAGLFASQIALVVHGLIDSVTWGMVRPAPLVWAIWGIAVAAWMGMRSNLDNLKQKSI